MTNYKRTLITSALPYANGPVHIGHLAGVYVPADIYARFLRMNGQEVAFIGGSDEHGVPITLKAKNEGVTPQDIVDKYHSMIKDSFGRFGISFDIYSRTSNQIHHQTASDIFLKIYEQGKFIEKTSEQYYDVENKQFLADRYITGTCPKCGFERAYGDQCESCGTALSPNELINPKSMISGNTPELKETKHWYLPLDQYEPWLKEWILEGHKEWKPNVYGQCKSWIDSGLQPTRRHPRPRLGRACSACRCRREGAIRLVRRADWLHFGYQRMDTRLGKMVERPGNQNGAFHRERQYCIPLHHFPGHAKSRGNLYFA